jgi:excisionase family DNA binding protein
MGDSEKLHRNDGRRGPLLTVRETAERLRVSEKTVRRMITKNEISAIRVGPRLIRIPEELLMNVTSKYRGL